MKTFLNQKRLRDYPRLFFFTMFFMLLLNWLFHQGWLSATGQIIGNDFLAFYSGGMLIRDKPASLYDFSAQESIQQALILPTRMWGYIPFINPPNTAVFFALLTHISYSTAFLLWSSATILCLIVAAFLISKYILPPNYSHVLPPLQIIFVSGSLFSFIEGLQVGQNHGVTLLFLTGTIVFYLQKKPFLAGILAGLMIYKPQFIFGFIILWMFEFNWKGIIGFILSSFIWIGVTIAWRGWGPFLNYIETIPIMMQAVTNKEMGGYLQLTLYSLLLNIFGTENWQILTKLNTFLMVTYLLGLGLFTYANRKTSPHNKIPNLLLAILFPLLLSPHSQLHDSVILIPFFAIWASWQPSRKLLNVIIIIYIGFFLAPLLAYYINFPLLAIFTIGLISILIYEIIQYPTKLKDFSQELTSI